jgi:hypothetical protein
MAHVLLSFQSIERHHQPVYPIRRGNRIMPNKKPYIENHKALAAKRLSARVEILKSKGMTAEQIQRDPKVKHYRADLRQANRQLADIAALESLNVQRAEIKAQKLAAPKTGHPKHKRSPSDPAKKKAKRERKLVAETAEAEE